MRRGPPEIILDESFVREVEKTFTAAMPLMEQIGYAQDIEIRKKGRSDSGLIPPSRFAPIARRRFTDVTAQYRSRPRWPATA